MLRTSLLVTVIGLSAFAKQQNSLCVKFYSAKIRTAEEAARLQERLAKRAARVDWASDKKVFVDQLFQPMFVKQFESEFSVVLIPEYKEMFRKLLFEPSALKKEDWDMLRSGFPHDTKISEENPNGSLLKSYLNLNHLTIDRQENDAEAVLSQIRGVKVELTQLEKVALRVARVIGRDYDFFVGSPYEVPEATIKRMKARFLSIFSFAGKTLSDKEIDALYSSYVINDDPVSTYRYSISQVYDFAYKNKEGKDELYITNEMIAARNERVLEAAEKFRNHAFEAERQKKLEDPALKAALNTLNNRLETDRDLGESIRNIRLMVYSLTGQKQPFKSPKEFGNWLEMQTKFFESGLAKIKEPGVKAKLEFLMKGMTTETTYHKYMRDLKEKLDLQKPEHQKMLEFMESELGIRLFSVVRDELFRKEPSWWNPSPKLSLKDLELAFERNLGLLEEVVELKRSHSYLFEAIYHFKLVRTGLTKAEVTEIFKIAQRNSSMRLFSLIKFDPLARYGFCFGRAYFFHRIMLNHGIHPDSLGKVLVDGRMSGGLTGWSWHIAATVEREGGGFWVLDQSHGEPQTLPVWFNHYRDHHDSDGDIQQGASKDDRIKIFLTPGDRFGREFWGEQDFNTNLSVQYESIWKHLGVDNRYFRDVGQNLERNGYNTEVKNAFQTLTDGILDALKIGL